MDADKGVGFKDKKRMGVRGNRASKDKASILADAKELLKKTASDVAAYDKERRSA